MKFGDLKTGDVVTLAGTKAVVMAVDKNHPKQPGFWLFVWYLVAERRLTFDCLSPAYELIPGSKVVNDGLSMWTRITNELAAPR
jgi:hypothetical protein